MQIELNTLYDARENVSTPDNDTMVNAAGQRYVLPLTGFVERFTDSPKDGQKGARFVVDERWGFDPGFTITLDLEALVLEPCCEGAPCDCPTKVDFDAEAYGNDPEQAGADIEGDAPGAAPGTASVDV